MRRSKRSTGSLFPPQAETWDKGHGRIESRRIWLSDDLRDYLDFPHAQVVFRLERNTTHLDGTSARTDVVYGLTSRPGTTKRDARRLLCLVRGHWCIENGLHWVRDVVYDEDRSRVRKRNGPRMMATLRKLAISLLRLAGAESIAKAIRWCARDLSRALRLVGFA